jgi:hypothetical protein
MTVQAQPLIWLPDDLSGYPRPDLITWVAATCVPLTKGVAANWAALAWCDARMGEQREGNILEEAQEGCIDYFDGDWQMVCNPFVWQEQFVIWFASRELQTEYLITWS